MCNKGFAVIKITGVCKEFRQPKHRKYSFN
jgi:hypothetical protein